MGLKCGIVGLPNVGKSTLFNALTNSSKAQAANFPFCTIDPNVGVVPVPDERLNKLSEISNSEKKINTTISFVDIAGLVKGASKGEGLGNKFLSHIREVDAIIHMIRCFESEDIQNVNKNIDPIRDLEIIETEMMLADLDSIQKRLEKNNKKNIDNEQLNILQTALDFINNNKNLLLLQSQFDNKKLNQTGLLSLKPKIFVCNVDEKSVKNGNSYTKNFIEKFGTENTLIISADIENQLNQLDVNEKKNYMNIIGLKETGLNTLIQKGYKILQLETFFTSGSKESKAWTIKKNCTAPQAAGEIHTDFEKGFIRAETVSYEDFINNKGWTKCKANGKVRLEGKEYVVKDGDVLNFRFNT
tara:strand:- start:164 stop:1237 length:1074 start_codon:yes stop_codon:yes gene_type:complete